MTDELSESIEWANDFVAQKLEEIRESLNQVSGNYFKSHLLTFVARSEDGPEASFAVTQDSEEFEKGLDKLLDLTRKPKVKS